MNLLITGAWSRAEDYIPELAKNHSVLYLKYEKEELPCSPDWVEGIVGNGIFLFHPIEQFTNLRMIQLTSAGFDRVPMDYVKEHDIEIYNARGVYSVPMAEYALTGVLFIYKNMSKFTQNQSNHLWEKIRDLRELNGKKVCIIGCGSVGSECATRFSSMGCYVYGIDPFVRNRFGFIHISNTDKLKNKIINSDIVIVTLPLTEETRHMINGEILSVLPNNAVVVNISRGAVFDTDSLIKELKTGRISAVLDVFEDEPLYKDSPLWDMENVVITPHNSFVGEGNEKRLSDLILRNL